MRATYILLGILFTASISFAQIDEDCKTDVEVVKLSEPVQSTNSYDVYGAKWTSDNKPLAISKAITKIDSYEGKELVFMGDVSEVCQVKGCWMLLTNGNKTARVHFKDYSFFVPSDVGGKKVEVIGFLKEKEISEEQAKHYAEDVEPGSGDKVTGSQKEYTVIASAVKIYK